MTAWTTTDPGAGDLDGLSGLAAQLDAIARHLTELGALLPGISSSTAGWTGATARVWRGRLGSLRADVHALADQTDARASALRVYVARVQDIADRAGPARSTLAEQGPTAARPPSLTTTPLGRQDADAAAAARLRWECAVADVRRARDVLAELAEERRVADALASTDLQPVQVHDWDALGAALSRSGIRAPGAIDADAVAEMILGAITGPLRAGRLTQDDLERMTLLVGRWADDPAVMARVFRTLGGHRTAQLVQLLGDSVLAVALDHDEVVDLALRLRAGLSVGSTLWSDRDARRFVAGLFGADDAAGALAFLFGDPVVHPMSATLATAAADALEAYERSEGPMLAAAVGGGLLLLHGAAGSTPLGAPEKADVGNHVLGTLARYPDAALAWLTGGERIDKGEIPVHSRVKYLFAERDSSVGGFEGAAALWAAVQRATGGALSDPIDPEVWTWQQEVNGQVFLALSRNLAFRPGAVTEGAAWHLADAVVGQAAALTRSLTEDALTGWSREGDPQVLLITTEGPPARAAVSRHLIAAVLTSVTQHPAVRDSFVAAVVGVQDALLGSGATGQQTLDGVLAWHGAAVGATSQHALTQAELRDEFRTGVTGGLLGSAEAAAALIVSHPALAVGAAAAAQVAGRLGTTWVSQYDEALRSIDDQQLREDVAARRVAAQLAELLDGSEHQAMRIYTDTRDAFRSPTGG